MPSLGPAEILVVLVIALLVFGPNKMPEIAKQVGKGFREFRRVQQHLKSELRDVVSEFDSPSSATVEQQAVPMLPPKDDSTSADVTDAAAPTTPPTPTTPATPPAGSTPVAPVADAPVAPAADVTAPLPSPEPDAPSEPT
jgi:sec-independent protein translocase protein TatA